jgi:hypothetical protein
MPAKTSKVKLYVQAKSLEHRSLKLGAELAGNGTWYNLADNVMKFMFDKLNQGDYIEATIPDDPKGSITFITHVDPSKEAGPQPKNYYPTKKEQDILDQGWRQQAIIWQNMMSHAAKCMECAGDFGNDYENARRLLVTTKMLYEASLEYLNTHKLPEWCKTE